MQFNQPDSVIPDPNNPLDWNRFSYVRYSPINYSDPSGNRPTECDEGDCQEEAARFEKMYQEAKETTAWMDVGEDFNSYPQFVLAYTSYQYEMTHPQQALEDAMADTDTFFWADTYHDYVIQYGQYQPFDEGPVMVMAEQAKAEHDSKKFYGLMLWLGSLQFFESAEKGFGGGSPQLTKLSAGEIKALKRAGINIHGEKGKGQVSLYDLYKDRTGEIYMKPKTGIGPGEPLYINIKDYTR